MPATKRRPNMGKGFSIAAGWADRTLFEHFPVDADIIDALCGEDDAGIIAISKTTNVDIARKGAGLNLGGTFASISRAKKLLGDKLSMLNEGSGLDADVLETVMLEEFANQNVAYLKTPLLKIETRRPRQAEYIRKMLANEITLGVGPAGTGKTFLAVAAGVSALKDGQVECLILTRPAVEAGERLGFLPGNMKEKVDPYMRPIYDALHEMLGVDETIRLIEEGIIEIAPLAFMRGRTLNKACVVLDEAQNTLPEQMKMFVTRLGEGTKAVITGDPTQNDLPVDPRTGTKFLSGLTDLLDVLKDDTKIARTFFTDEDVVRSPIVEHMVTLYTRRDKEQELARIAEAVAARSGQSATLQAPAPN